MAIAHSSRDRRRRVGCGFGLLSTVRPRRRLPLLVFIFLLVLFVIALGFICLCQADHPTQAAERAAAATAQVPAVITMWSYLAILGLPFLAQPLVGPLRARGRASPAVLQRFLF